MSEQLGAAPGLTRSSSPSPQPTGVTVGTTQPGGVAAEAARAAYLGEADAFVSHSWHDPPPAKWAALNAWGTQFRAKHGRAPLLWIDKECIDQTDTAVQLQSLPVYLAGCQRLLVLHGPTYLQRLWCVVELFVFFHAHLPAPPAEKIEIVLLDTPWETTNGPAPPWRRNSRVSPAVLRTACNTSGASSARAASALAALAQAEKFDQRNALAALPFDEERLRAVIEGSSEAPEHFNRWIRALVVEKLKADYRLRAGSQVQGSEHEHG